MASLAEFVVPGQATGRVNGPFRVAERALRKSQGRQTSSTEVNTCEERTGSTLSSTNTKWLRKAALGGVRHLSLQLIVVVAAD